MNGTGTNDDKETIISERDYLINLLTRRKNERRHVEGRRRGGGRGGER